MGKNKKKSVSNNNLVDLSVEGVIETVDFTSKTQTETTLDDHSENKDGESIVEPSVDEPSVVQPSVDEPSVVQPSVDEPSVDETSVVQPSVDEPSVVQPSAAEPSAVEPKCQILLVEPKCELLVSTPKSEASGDNKTELIEISIKPDEQKKETLETEVSPNCNRRLCSIL